MDFDEQDNWAVLPQSYDQMELVWQELTPPNGKLVLQTKISASDAWIRMNDFPDEPLYTLILSDKEIISFNDWPAKWSK